MSSDQLIFDRVIILIKSKTSLNSTEEKILQGVWEGRTYRDIALEANLTEASTRQTASQIWRLLRQATGRRIKKRTFRIALLQMLEREPL